MRCFLLAKERPCGNLEFRIFELYDDDATDMDVARSAQRDGADMMWLCSSTPTEDEIRAAVTSGRGVSSLECVDTLYALKDLP